MRDLVKPENALVAVYDQAVAIIQNIVDACYVFFIRTGLRIFLPG